MISVDSMYNKIVASIESDLPISVKKPNRVRYTGGTSQTGSATDANKADKSSFEDVLKGTVTAIASKNININMADITSRIDAAIANAASKYNVDLALIKGVVKAESSFDPNCVSSAGAMGLMQLMPGTASSLGVSDPFNIEQNIDGGVKYLRQMLDRFNNDVSLALAAYNAGPANVEKYGGIPPFDETETYVPRVLANMDSYKMG